MGEQGLASKGHSEAEVPVGWRQATAPEPPAWVQMRGADPCSHQGLGEWGKLQPRTGHSQERPRWEPGEAKAWGSQSRDRNDRGGWDGPSSGQMAEVGVRC